MAINIFGFELGKRKIPKSLPEIEGVESQVKSFIPPEVDDGASVVDFVGGYGFGVQLINYDVAYHNDGELVLRYRQMSEHAEVQTAIDDIVNQAVVLNEKSEPVSINLDKIQVGSTVKKKIKGEFDELLRLLTMFKWMESQTALEHSRSQKLKEALEFYASPTSWHYWDRVVAILDDDLYATKTHELFGGKRARQALAEYGSVE